MLIMHNMRHINRERFNMKKRLNELLLSEFIDLLCGDTSVLNAHSLDQKKIENIRNTIIFEYQKIADENGTQSFLLNHEESYKLHSTIILFQICKNLINMNGIDEAKTILSLYGLNMSNKSESIIKRDIEAYIKRYQSELKRIEESNNDMEPIQSTQCIREDFDKEIAMMSMYVKFPIVAQSINASVYAYMLNQVKAEIKAKMSMLKNK